MLTGHGKGSQTPRRQRALTRLARVKHLWKNQGDSSSKGDLAMPCQLVETPYSTM